VISAVFSGSLAPAWEPNAAQSSSFASGEAGASVAWLKIVIQADLYGFFVPNLYNSAVSGPPTEPLR
jgi:hypothetical protein